VRRDRARPAGFLRQAFVGRHVLLRDGQDKPIYISHKSSVDVGFTSFFEN
jgi:hypothetical protein